MVGAEDERDQVDRGVAAERAGIFLRHIAMDALEQIGQRLAVPFIAKSSAGQLGMLHHVAFELVAVALGAAAVVLDVAARGLIARVDAVPDGARLLLRENAGAGNQNEDRSPDYFFSPAVSILRAPPKNLAPLKSMGTTRAKCNASAVRLLH